MALKEYPVDENGNMMERDYWGKPKMVPVEPFEETMTFTRTDASATGVRLQAIDSKGLKWSFFNRNTDTIINRIERGKFTGVFVMAKQGRSYGLDVVELA